MDKAACLPETHYGVSIGTIILKDGQRIEAVEVTWGGEIIRYKGKTEIPFSEDQIADIVE